MPEITINVSYGEMLDALEDARVTLVEGRETAKATCGTTEQFVPRYDELLDIADMGLAQINAAIQDLYNRLAGPGNQLMLDYTNAVAACSQNCPLSEAARDRLRELGKPVPDAPDTGPFVDEESDDWLDTDDED